VPKIGTDEFFNIQLKLSVSLNASFPLNVNVQFAYTEDEVVSIIQKLVLVVGEGNQNWGSDFTRWSKRAWMEDNLSGVGFWFFCVDCFLLFLFCFAYLHLCLEQEEAFLCSFPSINAFVAQMFLYGANLSPQVSRLSFAIVRFFSSFLPLC
jgi:hypothetical protein